MNWQHREYRTQGGLGEPDASPSSLISAPCFSYSDTHRHETACAAGGASGPGSVRATGSPWAASATSTAAGTDVEVGGARGRRRRARTGKRWGEPAGRGSSRLSVA
jgi:hypothetical protein